MNAERDFTTSPFSLVLRVPPRPHSARSARAALSAFGNYHGLAPLDVEYLTFAVGEALANAILHARTRDDISISFRLDDVSIIATVSDSGRGLANAPAGPVSMAANSSETGRGFAIMQRCTDFFNVRSTPGKGTVVTLDRYRRP